ncbi:MAG: CRISPR-associated RecB family exonuclease Cas4 [Ignavibacteriae bacterium]|nr:MAG: CRISPR-associated RecB family exonuclease Cas4 [Ignavibacteriota bacterium]
MYTEDNFIMINSLQHYIFCPRQCGLIHIDDVWQENLFTVRGKILHEKVDAESYETRGNVKTVYSLRIHSYRYGLVGRCDVVEFRQTKNGKQILPVEFKAGEPKEDISDKVQLCAQVFCLEEMLNTKINIAAFFYGKIRRRNIIDITSELRTQTEEVIDKVRKMIADSKVPIVEYSSKCRNCSLITVCQPKALNHKKLKNYIKELYNV